MTATLTDEDRGKELVHETERIGAVTDVHGDTVYVDPQWDHVHEELREKLGWDRSDERHTVDESDIEHVRNNQIFLREFL
ncbi:MAG: hypothetical protein ABEH90_01210 [Halolamina sp.]